MIWLDSGTSNSRLNPIFPQHKSIVLSFKKVFEILSLLPSGMTSTKFTDQNLAASVIAIEILVVDCTICTV